MNTTIVDTARLQNLSDNSVSQLKECNIIGRNVECDIVLKQERGASRKHARITVSDDAAVLLTDLGSLNGTLVNGREIDRTVRLHHGDVLVFDEQEYKIHIPQEHTSDNDSVTVIANKQEAANPEQIKSAIRPVAAAEPNQQTRFDTALPEPGDLADEVWDLTNPEDDVAAARQRASDKYTAIPATSRPGGDTPVRIRSGQREFELTEQNRLRQKPNRTMTTAAAGWRRWLCMLPVLIALFVAGLYIAHSAGWLLGE